MRLSISRVAVQLCHCEPRNFTVSKPMDAVEEGAQSITVLLKERGFYVIKTMRSYPEFNATCPQLDLLYMDMYVHMYCSVRSTCASHNMWTVQWFGCKFHTIRWTRRVGRL